MKIIDYKFEDFKITFYNKDTTKYELIIKPPSYEENRPFQSYTKLTLVYSDKIEKYIKFYDYSEVAKLIRTELIKSSKKVFFEDWNYWGIINLETFEIETLECADSVYIERVKNTIVVAKELMIYAFDFNGNLIDEQPIDPPTEWTYFDNYIELKSIVFGKRILKIV